MQLDPATVIFAALAVFVLWKLRSVLGRKHGNTSSRQIRQILSDSARRPSPAESRMSSAGTDFAEPGSAVWTGLDDVARAQPGFAARAFLDGASEAYKMVVQSFSSGDEATLRSLTSDDVFGSFKAALADRAEKGETLETSFVGFKDIKIVDAAADAIGARISIRFDAQFITRDARP